MATTITLLDDLIQIAGAMNIDDGGMPG